MEIHKDNQKDKGVSFIHYNPDLFHNDQQFYLAYRKIERIASAVFLITGLIEKNDLIRQAIQEHSLRSLSHIVGLIGKHGISVADFETTSAHLLHLNSLLDIGFWSGSISQMNLSILQREISSTYETLNDLSAKYKNSFFISSDFFASAQGRDRGNLHTPTSTNVEAKDKSKEPASSNQGQKSYKGQVLKDSYKRQDGSAYAASKSADAGKANGDKGHSRREAILSLLKQKTNLTVKDFLSVVPEYSEKTIQRELLSLVGEGIVRKEGERRWSTYSLVS